MYTCNLILILAGNFELLFGGIMRNFGIPKRFLLENNTFEDLGSFARVFIKEFGDLWIWVIFVCPLRPESKFICRTVLLRRQCQISVSYTFFKSFPEKHKCISERRECISEKLKCVS